MIALAGIASAVVVLVIAARLRPRQRRITSRAASPRLDGEDAAIAVLEAVARELRSGATLRDAVLLALRRAPACLAPTREALERSATLAAALDDTRESGAAELVVRQVLRACVRAGGAMADTVDRGLLVLRERRTFARDRAVHAAQARLSATVMTFVPLAFATWSLLASERVRAVYARMPVAVVLAVGGLGLNLLGWSWMRRIVRGRSP